MQSGRNSQAILSDDQFNQFEAAKQRYEANKKAEQDKRASNMLRNCFFGSLDMTDVGPHTTARLVIVFSMVCAWGKNDDSHHPDSIFNKMAHNTEPNAPYTCWEWAFGILTLAALAGGAYREYSKITRQEELNSEDYLLQQRDAMRKQFFPEEDKTFTEKKQALQERLTPLMQKRWKKNQEASIFRHKIRKDVDTEFAEQHPYLDRILKWPNDTFAKSALFIYDTIGTFSFIFWITWMATAGLWSVPLANTVFHTTITLIATGIGLAFFAAKRMLEPKKQDVPQEKPANPVLTENNDEIYTHIASTSHLRLFLKDKHQFFKEKLRLILRRDYEKNADDLKRRFPTIYRSNEEVKGVVNIPSVTLQKDAPTLEKLTSYTDSERKNQLFHSSLHNMVVQATLTYFALWYVYAALKTIAIFTATTYPTIAASADIVNNFFGNPYINMGLGVGAAIIRELYTYASHVHNHAMNDALYKAEATSTYKPHRSSITETEALTKEKAFNQLLTAVNEKKSVVRGLQLHIRQQDNMAETCNENPTENSALYFIKNYNLDDIDVTNNHYYEQFDAHPSFGAKLRNMAGRAFVFVNGCQTWIFNLRYAGLPTGHGLFVPAIATVGSLLFAQAGAMQLFISLAFGLGIVGGLQKLAFTRNNRIQEQKAAFLDKLDERISSLRQADIELTSLIELHKIHHRIGVATNLTEMSRSLMAHGCNWKPTLHHGDSHANGNGHARNGSIERQSSTANPTFAYNVL